MKMTRLLSLLTALTLATAATAQVDVVDDRLYRAWGGRAGIRAVIDDLVTRLLADARMRPFFRDANREHLSSQLTDQLCQLAGGPCVYEGPSMAQAHEGMEIGKADFHALVELLQDAMAGRGIAQADQNRMLARLAPMHRQIVNR